MAEKQGGALRSNEAGTASGLASKTVLVDGFNLGMEKGSGIATYARNLTYALSAMGHNVEVLYGTNQRMGKKNLLNEIALYDAPPLNAGGGNFRRWLRRVRSPFGRIASRVTPTGEVITTQIESRLPSATAFWAAEDLFHTANRAFRKSRQVTPVSFGKPWTKSEVDLAHWTTAMPLRVSNVPNLYTVHDVVPLRLPFTTLDNKRAFFALCKSIVRTADHIVTVSEASRADIIRLFGVSPERITNTYQAVNIPEKLLAKTNEEVAAEIEGAFDLPWKEYFLFFGAIEPKKNLGRIVEAYLSSGVRGPLVIVGGRAWLDEGETALIQDSLVMALSFDEGLLRRRDRIRRFEYLPFSILVSLIRGAKATLFPSLYEGFGLPILESMLLGTPVISSTTAAITEVAGDAAILVDPYDSTAIRRAISELDSDEGLRAALSLKGVQQAAKFSEEAYRQRLASVYDRYF